MKTCDTYPSEQQGPVVHDDNVFGLVRFQKSLVFGPSHIPMTK